MTDTRRYKYPLQKIGAVETAETFLRKRAAEAGESDLTHYLDKAPDLPPDSEDELPHE